MDFITGATGLLGSQVLIDLLKQGRNVRVLLRSSSSRELILYRLKQFNIEERYALSLIEWIEGDLCDVALLYDATIGIECIFHCAGYVSFAPKDTPVMKEVNYIGTKHLVNAALENGVKKFGYISSIATLGRVDEGGVVTEETKWEPENKNSEYAKSKYKGELEVWRGIAEGLDAIIVNPSIILGEGNWDKGSSALFNTVYKGNKFYTLGINGFVDVQDVSNAFVKLMESEIKNERFVISGANVCYMDLFDMMAASMNVKAPSKLATPLMSGIAWRIFAALSFFTRKTPLITRATARTANSKYLYSSAKLENAIDFKFTPIEDTIKRVGEAYIAAKKLS